MPGIKLRPIVFKVEPPAPYVLLDSKAVQNYTGMDPVYVPPTFTTDKDFICYKMQAHRNNSGAAGFNQNSGYYGWYWWVNPSGEQQYFMNTLYDTNPPSKLTVGADGKAVYDQMHMAYRFEPNPMIPTSTSEFTNVKIIFQKSIRKAYFYIDGKQIAICNDWESGWNPLETNLTGVYNSDQTFGIQVYACDSLEAAEQC